MGKNTAKPKNADTDGASGRRNQLTVLIGGFVAIVAVAVIVAVATGGGGTATGDLEQLGPDLRIACVQLLIPVILA